ncbi:MAG: RDD family protein [Candidatus Obscuribacterales bacterium]|nr:RDD family protein [Candidatus Obscuribacterales bacterium]
MIDQGTIALFCAAVSWGLDAVMFSGDDSDAMLRVVVIACLIAIILLVQLLYTVVFETSPIRATPGKFLLGLTVADINLEPLSFFRASFRLIAQAAIIAGLWLLLGILGLPACYVIRKIMDTLLPHAAKPEYLDVMVDWSFCFAMAIGFCFAFFNSRRQTLFDLPAKRVVFMQYGYPDTSNLNIVNKLKTTLLAVPQQFRLAIQLIKGMRSF